MSRAAYLQLSHQNFRAQRPLLASVHGQDRLLDPQPWFHDKQQISRCKFDRLPDATTGFTTSALDGYGLRDHVPSDPVLVQRLVRLLHASFRPRLTTSPFTLLCTNAERPLPFRERPL